MSVSKHGDYIAVDTTVEPDTLLSDFPDFRLLPHDVACFSLVLFVVNDY